MKRFATVAAVTVLWLTSGAASADPAYDEAIADVQATLGFVPEFVKQHPEAGLAGAWYHLKELQLGSGTALDAKTKALIGLAVVAQIPCHYCIWADSRAAKAAGATDREIAEAVAVAATERYWSTMLNGLEADFDTFKAEYGRLLGIEAAQ